MSPLARHADGQRVLGRGSTWDVIYDGDVTRGQHYRYVLERGAFVKVARPGWLVVR